VNMQSVQVRLATPEDADGMARVQVDTWRDAYKGIVDPNYLAAMDPSKIAQSYRDRLGLVTTMHRLIACEGDEVMGYCASGLKPDAPYEGDWFMFALYVHPSHQGKGVGYALLAAAQEEGRLRSRTRMVFGVFSANEAAKKFYVRTGSRFIEQGGFELEGVNYDTDYCEYLL
jgi:ribosomal protein S18 acetylase RimI-like enzyme